MSEIGETPLPQIKEKPSFVRIISTDQRTEKEIAEGAVLFRNLGLLDVEVDTQAFNKLLRKNGLTPEQISNLEITFRVGTAADRNFHGGIIGGWHSGNEIELYTTLAANQERTYITYIPIKKEALVDFLLHESRHYVQEQTGMGTTNTFMAQTAKEVEEDPLEQDANRFAREYLKEAMGWINLKEVLDFEDNTGKDRVVGNLAPFGKFYNLDRRLLAIDPDNPVMYLEQEIERVVIKRDKKVPLTTPYLEGLFAKARRLVESRKLGMAEYNGILDSLARHFKEKGEEEFRQMSLQAKYKP